MKNLIIHVSEDLAKALPLTKAFEPVNTWDNEKRQFLDKQETNGQGVPLWEAACLLSIGWNAEIAPVRIRMASQSKPTIEPDPSKLMALLGQEVPSSSPKRPDDSPTRLERRPRGV